MDKTVNFGGLLSQVILLRVSYGDSCLTTLFKSLPHFDLFQVEFVSSGIVAPSQKYFNGLMDVFPHFPAIFPCKKGRCSLLNCVGNKQMQKFKS